RARGLVAVARAEFAVAQRQIPVAAHALVVDEDVPRAIHRLDRVLAVLRRSGEHVFLEVVPVPGLLPEADIDDLRPAHLLIAVVAVHAPHVLLDLLPERPSSRMPEDEAGRFL